MKKKVYKTIQDRIIFNEYAPGYIINEMDLAKELGSSRTPIREALSRLEFEKLVSIVPRAGAMVTSVEFQQIRDVYQLRKHLEGLIGKLAASRLSVDKIEEMENLHQKCLELCGEFQPKKLIKIDIRFREILNSAAGNLILSEISNLLYNLTVRIWFTALENGEWDNEVKMVAKDIERTMNSIQQKDPEQTQKVREQVIADYLKQLMKRYLR